MISSVQVERIRLFLNLLGQVAGISPSWDNVIRGSVADGAGSSEVDGAPGRLLFTAHFVDVGEQHTYATLQTNPTCDC